MSATSCPLLYIWVHPFNLFLFLFFRQQYKSYKHTLHDVTESPHMCGSVMVVLCTRAQLFRFHSNFNIKHFRGKLQNDRVNASYRADFFPD